uniref:Uncharacterized protein n=1 Tax=Romanomermis culicivorax TaxID=13658 RepID=A0A915IYX7_ROMCU
MVSTKSFFFFLLVLLIFSPRIVEADKEPCIETKMPCPLGGRTSGSSRTFYNSFCKGRCNVVAGYPNGQCVRTKGRCSEKKAFCECYFESKDHPNLYKYVPLTSDFTL